MLVRDATGSLRAVFFNQPFLNDVFHPHQRVILFGKLELTSHGLQMQNPQYEILRQETDAEAAADRVRRRHAAHRAHRPGLREDRTLTPKMQRALVHQALVAAAGGRARIRCRPRSAARQQLDRPPHARSTDVHFPPAGTPSTS